MDWVYLLSSVARAGHYASAALLFGCFAFAFFVARPAFRRISNAQEEWPELRRFLLRLALWSIVAAAVTAVLVLWTTAAGMSGGSLTESIRPEIIWTVLARTKFGHVWFSRVLAAALLAATLALLFLRSRPKENFALEFFAAFLAAAFLASLALVGHSNDGVGAEGVLRLVSDMTHLLAAGAWLGALPALVFVLVRAGDPKMRHGLRLAREAASRFSPLGVASVALLLLTGLVNSWYLVGTVPALVGTAYGQILLVKLALFAAMVTLAAVNRQRLTPRLASSSAQNVRKALQALRRNAIIETALGLTVLCVVGTLVAATPAAHEDPLWPFPYQLDTAGLVVTPTLESKLIIAGILAVAGVGGIVLGLRNRLWWSAVIGLIMIGAAFAPPAPYLLTKAYPTSFFHSHIPYNAASIARGQQAYNTSCAVCHGANGYGDGPAAGSLPIKPADLTGAHLVHHGVGTLFWWIGHGIEGTPMPGFADQLDESARWDLINFLRAQADAEQSNGMNAEVEPFRPFVGPDFAFQSLGHGQETLKELRGKSITLLVLYSAPDSIPRLEALGAARTSLEAAGVRLVAIPMTGSSLYRPLAAPASRTSFLANAAADAVAAFTLFRRVPTGEGVLPVPRHMEFLIDRAGYLRARWIPDEEKGWSDLALLQRQIDALNRDPPRQPAPEGHVH